MICLSERILIVKALLTERKRSLIANEVKNKKYHSVGTVLKSNIKMVVRGKIDYDKDVTLSFMSSYKHLNENGGIKRVLSAQTSHFSAMMRPYKCFSHMSSMPTLTYNWANSAIIEKDLILNIIHSIFNLRETEVVI